MNLIKTIFRFRQYGLRGLLPTMVALGVYMPVFLSAQERAPAPDARPKERTGTEGRSAAFLRTLLARLSDNERAKLRRLQQEDPKAFRDEIKKIVRRRQRETDEEQKQLRDLAKRVKAAKGEERKKLVQELTNLVAKIFDRRMKANWKSYENAAKRLEELKSTLKKRVQHRDEIVAGKVESLLRDPALKW